MEAAAPAAEWPIRRGHLALIHSLTDDYQVSEWERLQELHELLTRLADESENPLRTVMLRGWARTVQSWLRFAPR